MQLDSLQLVSISDNKQDCNNCQNILDELENIDDDTDRNGIHFLKTQDLNIATNYGVSHFPALIYFENQVPSIYEGPHPSALPFISFKKPFCSNRR